MARKQAQAIQDTVETDEDLEAYLHAHKDVLICMEVYTEFCGHCLATNFAIRKGKLEIGGDKIAMVKACADNIHVLSRFKNKSEPVFLFITNGKELTRVMFGPNGIKLCNIIEEELQLLEQERETGVERKKQGIEELLPEEQVKAEEDRKLEEEYHENLDRLRALTLAARKKRVNERRARKLQRLNFIMFWPKYHQAHYDLYEKWDNINISVAAKEILTLTPDEAKEALYMSDVDPNEACLYELMKDEVLVVLFKMFDTDTRDFVKLMRYALYEELPVIKEDEPPEKRLPPIPAYERYATISKTAREVRRDRYNAKMAKLAAEKEERDRLAAEQARLAKEAEEERLMIEKQHAEEERMARIAAGLPAEPEPPPPPEEGEGEEDVEKADTEVTETTATEATEGTDVEGEHKGEGDEALKDEEKVEVEEEFHSDVEIEGEEYIPPGGLFVPGLYSPPNDLAKANALCLFFPKHVRELEPTAETEFLPPHLLVVFGVEKRYDVQEIIKQYPSEILNVGIFVGEDPYTAEHVAYTIKQYDKMFRYKKHLDRLAVMVSRKRSLPLLQLAGENPLYISTDLISGEKECLALFPVGYGDDYVEEESVKEEEIEIAVPAATEIDETAEPAATEIAETVEPAATEIAETAKPAATEIAETAKPAETEIAETAKPAETEAEPANKPEPDA